MFFAETTAELKVARRSEKLISRRRLLSLPELPGPHPSAAFCLFSSAPDNPRVAPGTIGEARREIGEKFLRRVRSHQERGRLPPRMERIALAERDHFLGEGTSRFRAEDGGVDALLLDEIRYEIAQHGPAMGGLLAEFGA
jgi:hypothetical protein